MWYNPSTWFASEKANPAQSLIGYEEGSHIGTDTHYSYGVAFDELETVNRGVNLLVNACASLEFDIRDKIIEGIVNNVRVKQLHNLLNYRPNPYQSIQDFRTNIFTDFILEGNIFIYYDGAFMYHLPAANVQIVTDLKTLVSKYTYNGAIDMKPDEIIHIKDISSGSIYRGSSRLSSANRNIKILMKMQGFQEQFFDNGAVPGIVLTTENTLSKVAKDKTIAEWSVKYSPKNGARRPMILDSGLKPNPILASTFQEMDFDTSIKTHDTKILKA